VKTIFFLILVFTLTCCVTIKSEAADIPDDITFRAMNDELERSMKDLVIEGMPSPYFISYTIRESQSLDIRSRYGALVRSSHHNDKTLSIELRVGNSELDNTNFVSDWRSVWNMRDDLVDEDDYDALRHQIWLHTDKAYKKALETYAGKQSYLQANPPDDILPDFSSVEPFTYIEERNSVKSTQSDMEALVLTASESFHDFSNLLDWQIDYSSIASTQWYLNSEDSFNRVANSTGIIEIAATIQTEDGERLNGYRRYIIPEGDSNPTAEKLSKDVETLARSLENSANSSSIDEYEGPVLFMKEAAAQLISNLFVEQMSLPRKTLVAQDWFSDYFPTGKIAKRVKRRVFPDFVNIKDEPRREKWGDSFLAGHRIVDSEGVPTEKLVLVENGWLQTIPMNRQPTKKIKESNGHAHSLPIQRNVSGITNMTVSTSKPLNHKKMLSRLLKLSKEYGNDFGLVVMQLENPEIAEHYRTIDANSESDELLPKPTIAFKIFVEDGRMEPVRGLEFDEVTIRNLKDIVAMGKDSEAYNYLQPTIFTNFKYRASIITPSILVEEMELKRGALREPKPLTLSPFAEK
jgi:TldD protein